MHTLKLEVEDSVIDKVKMFLKQLPQNTVHIKKEDEGSNKHNKFNAIALNTKDFRFNREEANER